MLTNYKDIKCSSNGELLHNKNYGYMTLCENCFPRRPAYVSNMVVYDMPTVQCDMCKGNGEAELSNTPSTLPTSLEEFPRLAIKERNSSEEATKLLAGERNMAKEMSTNKKTFKIGRKAHLTKFFRSV